MSRRIKFICLLLIVLLILPSLKLPNVNAAAEWGSDFTEYVYYKSVISSSGGVGNSIEAIKDHQQVQAAAGGLSSIRWYTSHRVIAVTFTDTYNNGTYEAISETYYMLISTLSNDWIEGQGDGIAADTHYIALSVHDKSVVDYNNTNYTVLGNILNQLKSTNSRIFGNYNQVINTMLERKSVSSASSLEFSFKDLCTLSKTTKGGSMYSLGVEIKVQNIVGIAPQNVDSDKLKASHAKRFISLGNTVNNSISSIASSFKSNFDSAISTFKSTINSNGAYSSAPSGQRYYFDRYYARDNSDSDLKLVSGYKSSGSGNTLDYNTNCVVTFSSTAQANIANNIGTKYFQAYPDVPTDPDIGLPDVDEIPGGSDDFNPSVTGIIKADNRGSELFDVTKGIPSSEYVYANVKTKEYILNQKYKKISQTVVYPVTVNATLKVTELLNNPADPKGKLIENPKTYNYSYTYSVTYNYEYYVIDTFEFYKIKNATLTSNAINGSKIVLEPNGYTSPTVQLQSSDNPDDHIKRPSYGSANVTIDLGEHIGAYAGGEPNWNEIKSMSEVQAVFNQIKNGTSVKNDKLVVNGKTVLDDKDITGNSASGSSDSYSLKTKEYDQVESGKLITEDVLYKKGIQIPVMKQNGDYPSSGIITYEKLNGANQMKNGSGKDELNFNIDVNPIKVHTPVASSGSISGKDNLYQGIHNNSYPKLILNESFTVTTSAYGSHNNILGYGTRDYSKYVQSRAVIFPFDIYVGGFDGTLVKAGQKYTLSNNNSSTAIYLPSWVKSGTYDVTFYNTAINATNTNSTQSNANFNINNYTATNTVRVEVSGRLYGFKIRSTSDVDYNLSAKDNLFYLAGKNNLNGGSLSSLPSQYISQYHWLTSGIRNNNKLTLPLMQGKSVKNGYASSVKRGYGFDFDVQTIGGDIDRIFIIPTFKYISYDGKKTINNVDVYYSMNQEHYIQVGSSRDTYKRYLKGLSDSARNIRLSELEWKITYQDETKNNLLSDSRRINQENGFAEVLLGGKVRTWTGDLLGSIYKGSYDITTLNKSASSWYGNYHLPSQSYIIDKTSLDSITKKTNSSILDYVNKAYYDYGGLPLIPGKTTTKNFPFFLWDGYIVVNFDIKARYYDKDGNEKYLSYQTQWGREGYVTTQKDSKGNTFHFNIGDIIFYDTNYNTSADYGSGGTH